MLLYTHIKSYSPSGSIYTLHLNARSKDTVLAHDVIDNNQKIGDTHSVLTTVIRRPENMNKRHIMTTAKLDVISIWKDPEVRNCRLDVDGGCNDSQ